MSVNGTTATSDSLLLTSDLRPAAIALGTISILSATCSGSLLITLLVGAFASRKAGKRDERAFLRTHIGALVFCLILADLIQSVCGILTFVWVANGQLFTGTLCTIQGVFFHIGNVGTGFWNAVIAGHTFWTVVLRKRSTKLGIACVIAAGWTMCGLLLPVLGRFVMQNEENGPFYTIAGLWCFIPNSYSLGRLVLHFLLLLISASIIAVLYIQVALVLFGILIIDGGTWRFKKTGIRSIFRQFSWDQLNRPSGSATDESIDVSTDVSNGSLERGQKNKSTTPARGANTPGVSVFKNGVSSRPAPLKRLGIKMLWFPTGYFVLILPLTIYRLNPHLNTNLDLLASFSCLFLFTGTFNTIIYIYTRQIIGKSLWSRFASYTRTRITRGTVTTNAVISVHIQRSTTQPVRDDQSIELGYKKPAGGLTDTSSITSIPPVETSEGGDDFSRGYRESKVGFDFTGGKVTRHVLPTNSVGLTGAPDHLAAYPGYQEQHSQQFSPPRSLVRREEQETSEQAYPGHHPSFFP